MVLVGVMSRLQNNDSNLPGQSVPYSIEDCRIFNELLQTPVATTQIPGSNEGLPISDMFFCNNNNTIQNLANKNKISEALLK